jgi:hypothetical protein
MMELPAEVMIHSSLVGTKGGKGTLLQVNPDGYYEINYLFGERTHRTYFPIQNTVLICVLPEDPTRRDLEIER